MRLAISQWRVMGAVSHQRAVRAETPGKQQWSSLLLHRRRRAPDTRERIKRGLRFSKLTKHRRVPLTVNRFPVCVHVRCCLQSATQRQVYMPLTIERFLEFHPIKTSITLFCTFPMMHVCEAMEAPILRSCGFQLNPSQATRMQDTHSNSPT
jgi:hypothetical protein